ncbi:MAG: LuxR C-terminal-related transcriptional regulator, partial [Oscillospiraceae bacterium]|nr:LuxR C-terminal-related transcriptional regulator [Oscillospiraceae bacterium]
MDAMDCRIALHLGDLDRASTWYRDKAPKDPVHLQVMRRYQYITEAMCELALGDPNAALLTLSPLETYFTTCNRHIDTIHLQLLTALARYRQKNPQWKKHLSAGLDIAFEFHFIRPVSLYGTAVLPLLEECSWKRDEAFLRSLITAARMQAAYYPNYLQPQLSPSQSLTAMELQVLRLICADKSNAEIGEILGIKLPTVKTHVSHVLSKLGVSRRSEARTAAQRLWLLP